MNSLTTTAPTRLLIVGEAWGADELLRFQQTNRPSPLVGRIGYFLRDLLGQAKILSPAPPQYPGKVWMEAEWSRAADAGIHVTNVFQLRPGPESNDIALLQGSKRNCPAESLCLDLPPLGTGTYLLAKHRPELARLAAEIDSLQPNLILALGATASWALLHNKTISRIRGSIDISTGRKILPTYHPAAILRGKHEWRPLLFADLLKAKIEMESPTFTRLDRTIYIPESPADITSWWLAHRSAPQLSVDIETERSRWISEVGVAASTTSALWVPFLLRDGKQYRLYWKSAEEETAAWMALRKILQSGKPIIGQNFLYDTQYLLAKMNLLPRRFAFDTMIAQHAMFPGMDKDLNTLASIYCNEPFWKDLRRSGKSDDME
jgi:uracil-DNA glycosylase